MSLRKALHFHQPLIAVMYNGRAHTNLRYSLKSTIYRFDTYFLWSASERLDPLPDYGCIRCLGIAI
jgi:hypothetical protein